MVFATGLVAPEGPVALPDGTWLIVAGGTELGRITHISTGGETKRVIKTTGRPNSLAVDSRSWTAESNSLTELRCGRTGYATPIKPWRATLTATTESKERLADRACYLET